MVKKVPVTLEYCLLTQGKKNYTRLATQTLKAASITKLLENKLVTKNFKTGLDFADEYVAKIAHNKLARMMLTVLLRELSFLNYTNLPDTCSFASADLRNTWIKVVVSKDPSILKYLSMLNKQLIEAKAPYTFVHGDDPVDTAKRYVYLQPITTNRTVLDYYKSMFLIPQFFRVMKSLSRKTYFNDEAIRNANKSKRFSNLRSEATHTVHANPQRNAQTIDPADLDF